uniref:C2H2-type domain-containing protein n=1 Tax=Nyssomyia neivai TaxID=330878 RepID=A0A1L8DBC3_9DIPT
MFSSSLLVSSLTDEQQEQQPSTTWGNSLLNNDGEFSCDICPKTFSLLSALKVHRGWHFRSPDGRQVTDPGNLWQPGTLPPSRAKRFRPLPSKQPVCPYCTSKFASANNLRRHIVEVHKRNESRLNREAVNPGVFVEKERECSACGKSFETHIEWIEHKMGHAKNQKPSTTFEWNCEICGKMFTRKERLLQHMITHLNSTTDGQDGDEMEDDGDELEGSMEPKEEEITEEEVIEQEVVAEEVVESDKEDEGQQHSCDLCQVFFKNSAELRRHVTSHFINGTATIGNEEVQGDTSSPVHMKIELEEEVIIKRDPSESKLIEQVTDDDDDDEIEEDDEDVEELDEEDETMGQYEEEDEEFMEEYIDADEIEPKTEEVSLDSTDKSEAQAIVYKCRICATPHRSHFASIKCMEAHRMPTEWKCTKCQVFFGDAQQMREHLKLMHD